MKTSNRVVGFESELVQKENRNRKKYNLGSEPCGCKTNEHLPNCKMYHDNPRELLVEDDDSDENYHYSDMPITTTNLNITRTVHADRIEDERFVPHEDIGLLRNELVYDDEDDEVIPATPQRPRRRIGERQPTSYDRTYALPRRNIEHELEIASQEIFSDSDEIIESSRNEVFPRRRRTNRNLQDDPQQWINLANQTMVKTANTFREFSNVMEQKLNDISQMILNSTLAFSEPKYNATKQLHDAGIQSDTVRFIDQISEPRSKVISRVKHAITETQPDLIEQQLSATSMTVNPQRNKKVTRNVTITKKVDEKIPSSDVKQRNRSAEQQVDGTRKKEDILYSTLNVQSVRDAKGNTMMITAQTQRANDKPMSDLRECDYKKCETCNLFRAPNTIPMLPTSSSTSTPMASSLKQAAGSVSRPENLTPVLSQETRVTPSSSTTTGAAPPSRHTPASSSFHPEPIYDVPRSGYDPNISHIPVSKITPDIQGMRGRRHPQSESPDQHLEIPSTSYPYNLRPRPGRTGQYHVPTQRQMGEDQHQSYMKKKGRRQ